MLDRPEEAKTVHNFIGPEARPVDHAHFLGIARHTELIGDATKLEISVLIGADLPADHVELGVHIIEVSHEFFDHWGVLLE